MAKIGTILFLLLVLMAISWTEKGPELQWEQDLSKALDRAKRENKHIFLAFCSPWCVICKKMESVVCHNPEVVAYMSKHFVAVKINIAEKPELGEKYGADPLPTFVWLQANSNIVIKKMGYIYSDTFLKILRFVAQKHYEKMTWDQFSSR